MNAESGTKIYSSIFKLSTDNYNLLFLISIGLLIRFIGITYGLPSVYNSTEYFIAKHALSFGARQSLEPLNYIYPTLYPYLIFVLFSLYFVFEKLFGIVSGSADFAVEFLLQPTTFYMLGRSLNAVFIILAVILLYRTARFYLPPKMSLVIGLLLLTSFNIHYFTFWMVPDALLILGTTVVIYLIIKMHQSGLDSLQLFLGSLMCGLTISAKYNAGFLAFGWVSAILTAKSDRKKPKIVQAGQSFLGVLLGFFIGTPFCLIDFKNYFSGFSTIWSQAGYDYNFETGLPWFWEISNLIRTELILGLLLIMVFIYSLFRLNKLNISLQLIVLPTFLIVGSFQKKGLDYLIIIIPVLLAQLAFLISDCKPKRLKYLSMLLFIALILNFSQSVYANYLRLQKDTRKMAGEWIENNVKTGTKICYDHYHYDIGLIDLERFTSYGEGSRLLNPEVKSKLSEKQNNLKHYRLISARKKLDPDSNNVNLPPTFKNDDFLTEKLLNPYKSLSELKQDSIHLLIVNSDTYLKYLNNPLPGQENPLRQEFARKREFYETLFGQHSPVMIFSPDFFNPGPTIKIYQF